MWKKAFKKQEKIKGFLDGVEGGYVVGWVWNQDKPEERLEIVIYADGEPVAEGVADQFREDLLKAGIGDGKYGFRIELPESLEAGQKYIIKAKVKNANTFLTGEIEYTFIPAEDEILNDLDKLMLEEFDHLWFKKTYNIPHVSDKLQLFKIYKKLVRIHQVSPNPNFSEKLYLLRYKDVEKAVKKGEFFCGFAHYVSVGRKEGRSGDITSINEIDLKEDLKLLEALFDEKWYVSNYEKVNDEIKKLRITPFEHYLKIGIKKRYSPNSWFDEKWYVSFHEDVKLLIEEGKFLNGFEHYIKVGRKEGRIPRGKAFDIINFKFRAAIEPVGINEIHSLETKLLDTPTVYVDLEQPRINFVIPTFDTDIMFGGYISLIELIKKIRALGFNMRFIICEDNHMPEDYFWYNLEKTLNIEESDFDRISFVHLLKDLPVEISDNDIFIAYSSMTALTAYNLANQTSSKNKVIYLIQEDERIFYTNNSFRALIDYVYSLPLVFLFNTKDLHDYFMRKKIGPFRDGLKSEGNVFWFEPAITKVLKPTETELLDRKNKKVLFYARPEAHAGRNLFPMGVLALKIAIEKGYFDGSYSFHGIGAAKDYKITLSKGRILDIKAKMSVDEYKKTLKEYDIGLFLMYAPHPGLVGFEMASAGMIVVVNSFDYRDEAYFKNKSANFVVADPNPYAIAEALRKAIIKSSNIVERVQNAYIPKVKSWDEAFSDKLIKKILQLEVDKT